MDDNKRATIYFEPDVHRALRLKADANHRSVSGLVNEAVRVALADDTDDPSWADLRKAERSGSFYAVVRNLRMRGRI